MFHSSIFVLTYSNASNNFTGKCGLRNTDKKQRLNAITIDINKTSKCANLVLFFLEESSANFNICYALLFSVTDWSLENGFAYPL